MLVVFVTRKSFVKYLHLTGYMFEQSLPLRGMCHNQVFTRMSTMALIDYSSWEANATSVNGGAHD